MTYINVEQLYEGMKDRLKLTLLTPNVPMVRKIRSAEIHRPGLAFSGFYDYFAYDRVQVLGKTEICFLKKLKGAKRQKNLKRFFSYRVPCIIAAKNQQVPQDFLQCAIQAHIPVFRALYRTSTCVSQITLFIESAGAPSTEIHGTLLDIYGVGTLLMGESGVGKSETALELIERGQRLVADDVVQIRREGLVLMGQANDVITHHMEIRGLGIIDVQSIFGVGAVLNKKGFQLAGAQTTGLDVKGGGLVAELGRDLFSGKTIDEISAQGLIKSVSGIGGLSEKPVAGIEGHSLYETVNLK